MKQNKTTMTKTHHLGNRHQCRLSMLNQNSNHHQNQNQRQRILMTDGINASSD